MGPVKFDEFRDQIRGHQALVIEERGAKHYQDENAEPSLLSLDMIKNIVSQSAQDEGVQHKFRFNNDLVAYVALKDGSKHFI